jgi:hypothetical protein
MEVMQDLKDDIEQIDENWPRNSSKSGKKHSERVDACLWDGDGPSERPLQDLPDT